jgi:hypothetical protein
VKADSYDIGARIKNNSKEDEKESKEKAKAEIGCDLFELYYYGCINKHHYCLIDL